MISFLNSVVLPALIAIAIPIIIHFFNRRKTKKIPFSSIRFLKLLENQRIKQVRLYQILLILIRTLFVLFLVLAFSRPTMKSSFISSTSSARTTAVIVLDDSYSMQAYAGSLSKFRLALENLKNILKTFSSEDQVFVLPTSASTENISPIDLNLNTDELIKQYAETYSMPNLSLTLNAANQLFENFQNFNRELYLISDFRLNQSVLMDSIGSIFTNKDIFTYLIDLDKQNDFQNIGIDTVIIETQLFELNKPVRFLVSLQNYNLNEGSETIINLFMGNNRLAMEQVSLQPGQTKEINLTYIPNTTGQQLIQFELDDDDLLVDNNYYINFPISEKLELLYVDNQPSKHINAALNVLNQNTVLNIENSSFAQWYGKNFEKYDLIILSNPPTLNNESINRLNQYLKTRNLLILPGLNISISQFNTLFKPLVSQNILFEFNSSPGSDYYFALNPNTPKIPLFEPLFSGEGVSTELPKIFKYYKINKQGRSILSLQNGDPFFSQFNAKSGGQIFIFASMFDLEWSDFPVKGFFVPMLYRILFTSAQNLQMHKSMVVDEKYSVTLQNHSLNDRYMLNQGDTEPFEIIPEQSEQGIRFVFDRLNKPGHYTIIKNNNIIHAFSVNVISKELERPYLSFEDLTNNVVDLESGADLADNIKSARTGQELWYIFLFLALLMLILEMLLIKKIEGQGVKAE